MEEYVKYEYVARLKNTALMNYTAQMSYPGEINPQAWARSSK